MPRFALLAHDHPFPHWDLFLEAGPILQSWRLVEPLSPNCSVAAESIGDHRLLYLDYEGPVSGNRGNVSRIDTGTFTLQLQSADKIIVDLAGKQLVGTVTLSRSLDGWQCTFDAP